MSRAAPLRDVLQSLLASRSGASAVEFALISSTLLLMALGVGSIGLAALETTRLDAAARIGAQYAVSNPADASGTATAALAASSWRSGGTRAVALTNSCGCSDGSTVACAGSCASGGVHQYVTVVVSENFQLPASFPGLPNPLPLSASAKMRSQ